MNKREQLLLTFFVVALVAGAIAIGGRQYSRLVQKERGELAQKQATLSELQLWSEDKELWLAREDWIDKTPPPAYQAEKSESAFVEEIQATLGKHRLEISEQRIQKTKKGALLVEVGIDLIVNSTLEDLVRWLHATQRVSSFRAIRHIKLKSDQDNVKIKAEISVIQLYGKSS